MAAKHKKTSLWIPSGLFGIFLGADLVLPTACFSKDLSLENLPIYKKNTGDDPASQNKGEHPPEENRPRRWENIQQSFTLVEITEGRHGAAPQALVDGAYKGAFFKEF
jgi:hypothetical protein